SHEARAVGTDADVRVAVDIVGQAVALAVWKSDSPHLTRRALFERLDEHERVRIEPSITERHIAANLDDLRLARGDVEHREPHVANVLAEPLKSRNAASVRRKCRSDGKRAG